MQLNSIERQVCESRILRLFRFAEERADNGTEYDIKLSKRYISIALEISRHYKIKLPAKVKHGICQKCHMVLIPGKTCIVRVSGKSAFYKCSACGRTTRS